MYQGRSLWLLGTLRVQRREGNENFALKKNLRSFSLIIPTHLLCQVYSPGVEFVETLSKGSENEIKFRRCLFNHSKTCEIRHFKS